MFRVTLVEREGESHFRGMQYAETWHSLAFVCFLLLSCVL